TFRKDKQRQDSKLCGCDGSEIFARGKQTALTKQEERRLPFLRWHRKRPAAQLGYTEVLHAVEHLRRSAEWRRIRFGRRKPPRQSSNCRAQSGGKVSPAVESRG